MGTEPVGKGLRPGGFGVRVVRATEHGDEDLCRSSLAGIPIQDRYALACVVDEEFLAGRMVLPQHQFLARQPSPVLIAEHAVLPALGRGALVLLPQQKARHASA
jgi:hypothetical protein